MLLLRLIGNLVGFALFCAGAGLLAKTLVFGTIYLTHLGG